MRLEALIHSGRHLLDGWSVVDRLVEITAPTQDERPAEVLPVLRRFLADIAPAG